jgi:hypothetical protein
MMQFRAIAICFLFLTFQASADEKLRHQAIFQVERSKNANVVQYDVQVHPDGALDSEDPVVAYWIRHAEEGQAEELSWVQRNFAYGFDIEWREEGRTVELELKADIGRSIQVRHDGTGYIATTLIDGVDSRIERIFIHATGKGLGTKVHYIDLFGTGIADGSPREERVEP